MIAFNCGTCSKAFTVPDEYAGRTARCKGCGGDVIVPTPANVPTNNAPRIAKPTMRTRRLQADAQILATAFHDSPLIKVTPGVGSPPESYIIEYSVNSLERGRNNKPQPRAAHQVELQLTSDYPRLGPKCKMLTPIFHPNIDPATICVGDHWTAGERLADLIIRIGQMIAYQEYNIQSPLDAEAAMWADLNKAQLPIDPRDLRPASME